MISTLLFDEKCDFSQSLETHLKTYCPHVEIKAKANSYQELCGLIREVQPELVFTDLSTRLDPRRSLFRDSHSDFEMVYMSEYEEVKGERIYSSNHLFKPIKIRNLINVIQQVQFRIEVRKAQVEHEKMLNKLLNASAPNDMISIPTLEGIDFLKIDEIVRCEGLHKYTRIFTVEKTDIISSYSIGQFNKLLEVHGFFPCHKSHLINLRFLKKFLNEGTLIMRDDSEVPVSRRKRASFLERIQNFRLSR